MIFFPVLLATSMHRRCWAHRGQSDAQNVLESDEASKHAVGVRSLVVTPRAMSGLLDASTHNETETVTKFNAPGPGALITKWRAPCEMRCQKSGICPPGFCTNLTATMRLVRNGVQGHLGPYWHLAFVDDGVPAACEIGLCKDVLPTLLALSRTNNSMLRSSTVASFAHPCAKGYCLEVLPHLLAMAEQDEESGSTAILRVFPQACRAGYCKEVLPALLAYGRDSRLRLRQHVAEVAFREACRADLCAEVLPLIPALSNDNESMVRKMFIMSAPLAMCRRGFCEEIIPQVLALASDADDDVRQEVATLAVPAVCTAGRRFCEDVLPAALSLIRDPQFNVVKHILSDSMPALCAAGFFQEFRPMLVNYTEDFSLSVSTVALSLLGSCQAIVNERTRAEHEQQRAEAEAQIARNASLQATIKAEAAMRAEKIANIEKAKAFKYLEDVEVQKIRARTAEHEAHLKMEEASRAQEAALDAKAQLQAEKAIADDLKAKLWGAVVAFGAAVLPLLVAIANWSWRRLSNAEGDRKDSEPPVAQ